MVQQRTHISNNNSTHKKRTHYGSACSVCRADHRGCDGQRPCFRCVKVGCADQCIDVPGRRKRRSQTHSGRTTRISSSSSSSSPVTQQIKRKKISNPTPTRRKVLGTPTNTRREYKRGESDEDYQEEESDEDEEEDDFGTGQIYRQGLIVTEMKEEERVPTKHQLLQQPRLQGLTGYGPTDLALNGTTGLAGLVPLPIATVAGSTINVEGIAFSVEDFLPPLAEDDEDAMMIEPWHNNTLNSNATTGYGYPIPPFRTYPPQQQHPQHHRTSSWDAQEEPLLFQRINSPQLPQQQQPQPYVPYQSSSQPAGSPRYPIPSQPQQRQQHPQQHPLLSEKHPGVQRTKGISKKRSLSRSQDGRSGNGETIDGMTKEEVYSVLSQMLEEMKHLRTRSSRLKESHHELCRQLSFLQENQLPMPTPPSHNNNSNNTYNSNYNTTYNNHNTPPLSRNAAAFML